MNDLAELSVSSRVVLYGILALMALLTLAVGWAQIGILRGRPFENPDGTADDWREQKIFYGIAWADLTVACPLAAVGLALALPAPRTGLFLLVGVAVWFVWTNVMTTVTSLRFEAPRITVSWLVVFPLGAVVGLMYLVWMAFHFAWLMGRA